MNKRPKKYDTRDVIYDPSSGETNIKLTIPQEDIEKGLKGTQYSKHKWESIDIRLIYKNGKPNFAYIPQEPELDKIRAEIEEYKSRQLTLAIGVDDLEKGKQIAIEYVLAVLDKYKAESEDKE